MAVRIGQKERPNAPVNWQQRAQHVDVQLNAELGAAQVIRRMRTRQNADGY